VSELISDADFVRETTVDQGAQELVDPTSPGAVTVNGLSGNVGFDQTSGHSGFTFSNSAPNIILVSPLTTKGDLYAHNGTNGVRMAVGASGGFLQVDPAQATGLTYVLGVTGWVAATGTATRSTFDTTTVTLPELAERLKALIDDLLSLKAINT